MRLDGNEGGRGRGALWEPVPFVGDRDRIALAKPVALERGGD